MTEDLADLEQRRTGPAHGRGGAMAQAMGTDPLDPGRRHAAATTKLTAPDKRGPCGA